MAANESSRRLVYYRVLNVNHAGISEVLPGLYISGVCALKASTIQEYNITMIVNATSEVRYGKRKQKKTYGEGFPII
ncbi:unnamed protein product [Brugia timori]|uniref:Late embryogenesis abundant protein, LEA-14 n=1 Tax=Brugia timori TaxID=42155 RepID=A0A0R3QDR5_9BILA|nr:unnamed protein product [Brugia timori]